MARVGMGEDAVVEASSQTSGSYSGFGRVLGGSFMLLALLGMP